jgi:MFS family permease
MIDKALRAETESAAWSEIFHHQWRRPLMIGIGLAVFQQITGINAIIYYANQIFASAGFALSSQATLTTWAIGGVNVVATIIALAFVDRWGGANYCWADCSGWELAWPCWEPPSGSSSPPRRRPPRQHQALRGSLHYAVWSPSSSPLPPRSVP